MLLQFIQNKKKLLNISFYKIVSGFLANLRNEPFLLYIKTGLGSLVIKRKKL